MMGSMPEPLAMPEPLPPGPLPAGYDNVRFQMVDDGYVPRGRSMLRRVQEERVVGLFFGQRALCIGALAPLNYVGTSEHTHAKLTPFKRLVHTGNAFEKIFFGTRGEADRILKYVAKLHDRVN